MNTKKSNSLISKNLKKKQTSHKSHSPVTIHSQTNKESIIKIK